MRSRHPPEQRSKIAPKPPEVVLTEFLRSRVRTHGDPGDIREAVGAARSRAEELLQIIAQNHPVTGAERHEVHLREADRKLQTVTGGHHPSCPSSKMSDLFVIVMSFKLCRPYHIGRSVVSVGS